VFAFLVLEKFDVAAVFVILGLLALGGWHWRELPERAAGVVPAGWWGMAMVIASEATLLACFLATFWYLRLRMPHWPPAGLPEPRVVVPMALTGVLLLTSVPMQLAARAVKAGRVAATRAFLLVALVVQTGYFAYEVSDYHDQLHRFGITRNAYSSVYYTLLGADHAHVLIGILLDLWLLARLAGGLTKYRRSATVAISWYWHFVNVMTVLVIGSLTAVNVV
jgi:heme/copper-type cytochrome/quinol oxidase subunit 3